MARKKKAKQEMVQDLHCYGFALYNEEEIQNFLQEYADRNGCTVEEALERLKAGEDEQCGQVYEFPESSSGGFYPCSYENGECISSKHMLVFPSTAIDISQELWNPAILINEYDYRLGEYLPSGINYETHVGIVSLTGSGA